MFLASLIPHVLTLPNEFAEKYEFRPDISKCPLCDPNNECEFLRIQDRYFKSLEKPGIARVFDRVNVKDYRDIKTNHSHLIQKVQTEA
ncbi:hypothetical protein AYI68_g6896 [Smittium mucronatum]|uniref:Uncharacterized protein n=1 Tax=Smittium mucronatum TaxID=133383 RepID=A0A1R0GQ74_9FUNG|nr:hypothetical protein AYI68_g6896 [Smittium mucronatum]